MTPLRTDMITSDVQLITVASSSVCIVQNISIVYVIILLVSDTALLGRCCIVVPSIKTCPPAAKHKQYIIYYTAI
jgi:hypothetical protein